MMSEFHDHAELDRLVDGELSPTEYRALLARLEEEPAGWRNCALAFLEAQALKRDLGAMRQKVDRPAEPVVTAPVALPVASAPSITGVLLAMAASFVLAFALGAWWRSGSPATDLANTGAAKSPQVVADKSHAAHAPLEIAPAHSGQPLGRVTVLVNGGQEQPQRMELPVYGAGDPAASEWQRSSAVPEELLQAIERAGHSVRRRQNMMPLPLNDGRRVVVPVEQLEIVPVGGVLYQ